MLWIHHDDMVSQDILKTGPYDVPALILNKLTGLEQVERIVLEGHLGSEAVPSVQPGQEASYYRARLHSHPVLVMRSSAVDRPETIDTWFSPEARGAWRYYVEGDTSTPPPRRRTKVYRTGDEATPYVILGARIRRWNGSQDLPKPLVGATAQDPDGVAFLSDLGRRRWKPIVQPLVAEMVKEALRPVPEATPTTRYQIATLGEGQMIRYGRNGPVWIDAEAAVHLADLAGYALGYPDEISHPLGGDGWSRLAEIVGEEDPETQARMAAELKKTESVTYEVFAREIGAAELKRTFPEYRWGRGGRQGERMRDVSDADYLRMLFRGHPAVGVSVAGRQEYWLSSSAQAKLIESLSQPDEPVADTIDPEETASTDMAPADASSDVAEEVQAEPEPAAVPRLRKRQRKALAKLARAIDRLGEEGLSLVLQGGVLKARVDGGRRKKEGLVTVFPEATVIPNVD